MGTAGLTNDARLIAKVRACLDGAEFTAQHVDELAGASALAAAAAGDDAGALRNTRDRSPLSSLVRLFVLGVELDAAAAEEALAPLGAEGWVRAGLIASSARGVRAQIRLAPVAIDGQDLLVAHDPPAFRSGPNQLTGDSVLGVGPTSHALAALTIRRTVRRSLDLGSGSGIQSLLLAGHSDEVVATDLTPRAVEFCRFTMALNAVTNVECRRGDRFEPVRGEEFDLIVSNPPFIVSPDSTYRFRDGGLPLDGMARSVVGGAAVHLTHLGFAEVMASWPHVRGERWQERVRGWVEGLHCDAWALQLESQDAGDYARRWLGHGTRDCGAFDRWLDAYEAEGIEGFGYGLVVLRRVEHRAPWWRSDEAPQRLLACPAEGLYAGFTAAEWLLTHDDDSLLDARLAVHRGTRLESRQRAANGGWVTERAVLRQFRGMPFSGAIDSELSALVASCDGSRSLRQAIELAGPGGEVSPGLLDALRRLIGNGYLVPTELSSAPTG